MSASRSPSQANGVSPENKKLAFVAFYGAIDECFLGGVMKNGKFSLKKITLPRKALEELSAEERYCLHLVGHIFNEIFTLTKFVIICTPRIHDATEAERNGAISQAMLFSRLLAGKLLEAKLTLSMPIISRFLKNRCYPFMEENAGRPRLNKFKKSVDELKWLSRVRNRHAMHFPTYDEAEAGLKYVEQSDFEMFFGDTFGEYLFTVSDTMAGVSFFSEVNEDWKDGMNKVVEELPKLGNLLCDFLHGCMGAFLIVYHKEFVGPKKPFDKRLKIKDVPKFKRHKIGDFEVPYFFVGD